MTSGGLRASARGSASRARCHRWQAPNIRMLAATRGGSGLRTAKTSSHAGLCDTQQVADAARHKPRGCDRPVVHCTKKARIQDVADQSNDFAAAARRGTEAKRYVIT